MEHQFGGVVGVHGMVLVVEEGPKYRRDSVVLASGRIRRPDTKFEGFFQVTQASEQDVNVLKILVLQDFRVLDVFSACMEMQKPRRQKDSSPVQNSTFEPL